MEISNGHHQAHAMANHQLDHHHHHHHHHEVLNCPKSSTRSSPSSASQISTQHLQQQEKKPISSTRPQPEQALRCPRCDSTNTKFCYYNNYSFSQPRYFCKGCRRYWTKGGSLRNVPVGGGCRKNKRSSPSSTTPNSSSNSISSSKKISTLLLQDHHPLLSTSTTIPNSMPLPPLTYDPSDLTLAFSSFHHSHHHDPFLLANPNPNPNPNPNNIGAAAFLDILRGGDQNQNQNQGGLLYYGGFGGGGGGDDMRGGMLSFDAGGSDSTRLAAAQTGVVVANAEPAGSNVNSTTSTSHGSSLGGLESAGRDYWNGVASNSTWHGLINSSLL